MSVCQRQQGKELFGFVQKLTELKLWSKVRSNPDLYVADDAAAIKILYVRSMSSAPVFAFDDPNWSQVHPKAMALEGWITQMEVRYMSDDAIKAMFYIQLEDMKFKTVIEILQMNAFYSYCFPESHLKELRKIEGQIESQRLSIQKTKEALNRLQKQFEQTLEKLSKLSLPRHSKIDLGPCFDTLMRSNLAGNKSERYEQDVSKCLSKLIDIVNRDKPHMRIEYLQAIPLSGNDTREPTYQVDENGNDTIMNVDHADELDVTGFVVNPSDNETGNPNTAFFRISVVMTDRYGCVRLDYPIELYTGRIDPTDSPDVQISKRTNGKIIQWKMTLNSLPKEKQAQFSWNNVCRSVTNLDSTMSSIIRNKLWAKISQDFDWSAVFSRMVSLEDPQSGQEQQYLLLTASQPIIDADQMIEIGNPSLQDSKVSQAVGRVVFDRTNQDPPVGLNSDGKSVPIDADIKMTWEPDRKIIRFYGFFECAACDLPFQWGTLTIYHSFFGHVNTYHFTIQRPAVSNVGSQGLSQQKWEVFVDIHEKDKNNVPFLDASVIGDADIAENCIAYAFASPSVADLSKVKEENVTVRFPSKTICRFIFANREMVLPQEPSWNQLHPDYALNSRIEIL